MGIDGGGLFLYQPEEDTFINFTFSEENAKSLSSDMVLSICEDRSKNLWIGTLHGGLNKVNLDSNLVNWHIPIKEAGNIFENEIRTLALDNRGNIWVGNKMGRIFCYDNTLTLKHQFPDDLNRKHQQLLSNINVYFLFVDNDNNLWVTTKGRGIFIFKNINREDYSNCEIIHLDPKHYPSLDNVYAITQDQHNQYWIGSFSDGLSLLKSPFGDITLKVFKSSNKMGDIADDRIRCMLVDKKGNLWLGTSIGVSLLPNRYLLKPSGAFISIVNNQQNISSLSDNIVDYIFEASDGKIYVATMGGGLNRLDSFNIDTKTFNWKFFNTTHGLSSNTIYAIEEDEKQNLWLSSNYGINKFNIKNESIENFYVGRKFRLNYFTESCVTKLSNGVILFGHRKGFITFKPQEIKKDTTSYPIVLSRIFINGIEILPQTSPLIQKSINCEHEIQLSHKENSIRLDFTVLDYAEPEKIKYTYQLEGIDEQWSSPLTSNSAIYKNLPPGHYTFKLKATNSDGYMLRQVLKFNIIVNPPFLQTAYGYAIMSVLLLLLVITFLVLYKKKISAQHEIIYTEKLNNKKLEYYTNISHEFKTPLSLIIGPAKDLLDENKGNEAVSYYARKVLNNAGYLLNLVEQILDFRKINEKKMVLQVADQHINQLLKSIYNDFTPLAQKNNINFYFEANQQNITGFADPEIISKITYNLLSNAFKFTASGMSVVMESSYSEATGMLTIKFKDQGVGISKEDQEKLFERFGKSNNSSGIGLFYVKELVQMHKGTVEVESELHRGTTFTVTIPIAKKYYTDNERTKQQITENPQPFNTSYLETNFLTSEQPKDPFENTILIIEDNDEMKEYLSRKLSKGYNVQMASNGKEGVEIANKILPDLIICDVMMPVMDGMEATRILRDSFNTSHIPIILLTANSSEDKKLEGFEHGADDYINKPFNFKHLQLKIKNIITKRKKLSQSFVNDPELPANILTKSEHDKVFIEKVTAIIEENLNKSDFNVDMLSAEMGCSRTIFYKKMKGITSDTPNKFITTIQMKKAALLLKDTNYSLFDVSIMVGYNDKAYFSRTFKKHFGMTPKAYQLQFKNT